MHGVRPCWRPVDPRAATSRGVVGTLFGFRHTVRRRLGRAVCGGVGSREPDALEQYAREQYALRTRSPQLLRGAVWWWGMAMDSAPERGDGEGAVLSARRRITEAVTYYILRHPEATLRLAPSTAPRSLLHAADRGVVRHRHPVRGGALLLENIQGVATRSSLNSAMV